MRIAVVTVAYNLPGFTERLVNSAKDGCTHDLLFIIFLHSTMPDKVRECEQLATRDNVIYKDHGVNRGLSKSWNEGILLAFDQGCDVPLVVNEDAAFGAGDASLLSETAINRRDCYLVTGNAFHHDRGAWDSSAYGCFAINPVAMETLGCFDENFFPLYYEDSDYK